MLQPSTGNMKIKVRVEGFDAAGNSLGVREKNPDLATKQFAQLIQLNILNTGETIKDTAAASNAESANTAASAPTILAGTGGTAATVADYTMQTQTETVAATINAWSGSGSSGSFTVTGTITAGSNRAYQEVGLRVTVNAHTYLICRDTFSTLNVSSGGTLAVTYTITFS